MSAEEGAVTQDDKQRDPVADEALARRLVEEGWLSVSNKYRTVARFRPPFRMLTGAEIVRPELLATPAGRLVAEMWDSGRWNQHLIRMGGEGVESTDLTRHQYEAFRKAGGRSA